MHILLIADGRSPITLGWIRSLQAIPHAVSLISTYPCDPPSGLEHFAVLPAAFAFLGGSQAGRSRELNRPGRARRLVSRFRRAFLASRYLLGPLTLLGAARRYRRLLEEVKPDLVHALRIPFEGMLAAGTPPDTPLAVSIWGNDLTLHARGSPLMGAATRRTLRRADGLLADTRRDLRLAQAWGFDPQRPSAVVPGGGGVDLEEIDRLRERPPDIPLELLPRGVPLVVNPRGFRPGSVRNDTFFKAVPLVLERQPKVCFACCGMAGQPEALHWLERLGIVGQVRLLPFLSQVELWELFLRAAVTVSVSQHDGTPNSLLEAMACGCFPVAGDIESLREWITPGLNGLLCPPDDPAALAEAILQSLESEALRARAARVNREIILERAGRRQVRQAIAGFYTALQPGRASP